MSAACMDPNLDYYIQHQQQTSCPTSPPSATYGCLCASNTFLLWYMNTLCVNCNGTQLLQNPLSNLTALCPTFASIIENLYSDGCSPYAKLSQTETSDSRSSSFLTTSSLGLTESLTTTSSSSSSPTSGGDATTIILSIATPSPSQLQTITAVVALSSPSTQPIPLASSNSTNLSTSIASSSTLTPQLPLAVSSSRSGMSSGARAGIGVGAAAAAIGIGFVFISLFTFLRRRNSRTKGPGYERHDAGYTVRRAGGGSGGLGDTMLTEMYQDDDRQISRGFAGSDSYGSSGLGIAGIGGQREKIGSVSSGRIREVRIEGNGEHSGREFAMPLHAEGVREIFGGQERTSNYASEEENVTPRRSDGIWHSAVERQGPWMRQPSEEASNCEQQDAGLHCYPARESNYRPHDAEPQYSTAQESSYQQAEAGTRHSAAHESNYEAAMRPKSRIYSVVQSPVLDLGQADLSLEELERLEDEERRIDEAIRESESRARIGHERWGRNTVKAV